MSSGTVLRYQMIADSLRNVIRSGGLPPGARIPSYRSLMEEHSVAMNTVRQAVSTLEADGLVESVHGVGCVVLEQKPAWRHVGVAILHPRDLDFFTDELRLLHDEFAAARCDVVTRIVPEPGGTAERELLEWARRQNGVLLVGHVTVRVAETLARAHVPVLTMGEPSDGPCPPGVSMVNVDVAGAVRLAVNHLLSMGHVRIGLVNGRASRYYDAVSAAFATCRGEYALDDDCVELRLPVGREKRTRTIRAWFQALDTRPTALIVENGRVASAVMAEFVRHGISVPGSVSLLAITGSADAGHMTPGMTCVLTSALDVLKRGVQILAERVSHGGGEAVRESQPARFVPGRTCRALTRRGGVTMAG